MPTARGQSQKLESLLSTVTLSYTSFPCFSAFPLHPAIQWRATWLRSPRPSLIPSFTEVLLWSKHFKQIFNTLAERCISGKLPEKENSVGCWRWSLGWRYPRVMICNQSQLCEGSSRGHPVHSDTIRLWVTNTHQTSRKITNTDAACVQKLWTPVLLWNSFSVQGTRRKQGGGGAPEVTIIPAGQKGLQKVIELITPHSTTTVYL